MSIALLAVPAHCSRAPRPSLRRAHRASRRVGTATRGLPRHSAATCQLELPGLGDEIVSETAMGFARRSRKSRLLIQTAGRRQVLLRPQDDALIARRAREAHTLPDQRASQAEAASLRLHHQQPQLYGAALTGHQEN